jgi:uncharacterized protein DUF5309
MAIIAGTTGVYSVGTAGGNREDLEDMIWDLFVEETYCLSNFDRVQADGVNHEWMLDALAAASVNAQLEGNQEAYTTLANPTRVGNPCQISDKLFLVSRTQEKVAKAGRTSEIQRNAMKKMRELKNDIEFSIVRNNGAVAASASITTRMSAGMESWIVTNVTYASAGTGQSHPAFSGGIQTSSTSGVSLGALTETIFTSALELAWGQGGTTSIILTNARQKSVINGFGAGVQKTIDLASGSTAQFGVVGALDMYVSSFGNHRIVLHRHVRNTCVMAIDPSYWAVAFLDAPFVEPYAKTADGEKRHMAAEWTLVSRNQAASAIVDSISTP